MVAASEPGEVRAASLASAIGLGSHGTHRFSSVSLLASWASGARRARGPRGSRSTQGTSLTTIALSGQRSQAQRRMFQEARKEGTFRLTQNSDPDLLLRLTY